MPNRKELMRVALGETPADLLLRGGTVVNVYTGECLDGWEVAVAGDRNAAVGPPGSGVAGPATRLLDVGGKVVIPGFIDGHTHMDNPLLPDALVPWALRGGTTAIITEMEELSSAMGIAGALWYLEAVRDQPVRFYVTAPSITYTSTDDGAGRPVLSLQDMETILDHPVQDRRAKADRLHAALRALRFPRIAGQEKKFSAFSRELREESGDLTVEAPAFFEGEGFILKARVRKPESLERVLEILSRRRNSLNSLFEIML